MSQLVHNDLSIIESPIHGYGVFANKDLTQGELIEECYALVINSHPPELTNYVFQFKDHSNDQSILPLGFGCLYNHSNDPNAQYRYDIEHQLIRFEATRAIKKGDEIFISYGKNWFSSRQLKAKEPSLRYRIHQYLSATQVLLRFAITMLVLVSVIVILKNLPFLLTYFTNK